MYAKINVSRGVGRILQYHEQKVEKGIAQLLLAGNALKDPDKLDRQDKVYHFERRNVRNAMAAQNTLHICLSFHPSDDMPDTKMQAIALEYMRKMRLDRQPFLAYRHFDTLHPHLHIVCTNIQRDGSRIDLQKADFHNSKKATKELERDHSLRPAGMAVDKKWLLELPLRKVEYGKMALTPAFSRVLEAVVDDYKYTSLAEFNAVLALYNIKAVTGKENGMLYQRHGLLYQVAEKETGGKNKFIRASNFAIKPTLKNLEKRFDLNLSEPRRDKNRQRVTVAIDWTLGKTGLTPYAFKQAMEKERISVVFQQDKEGTLQNIAFVDHQTRSVFDGAALGGRYTAGAIRERCIPELEPKQQLTQEKTLSPHQKRAREHELEI